MTIFVSIAAYRDAELLPTIMDCLARARDPGAISFGICWQHDGTEAPPPAIGGDRMRVIDVPWRDSKGACWARAQCMTLYRGEDWFLQLDSHHRFVQDWDAILLDQAVRTGTAKPVLSTYTAGYDPALPLPASAAPTVMRLDRFSAAGIPLFQSMSIHPRATPVRARFVSGHLLFAPGSFIADVPYDPDLYFYGEEISLAVRAFTHGYDLFHPGAHIVWHQYVRDKRPKHWDDHVAANRVERAWHLRDTDSQNKVRRLLDGTQAGAGAGAGAQGDTFGLGTVRSLDDYRRYAGIDFARNHADAAARKGAEPPPPPGAAAPRRWAATVALDPAALPPAALDNPLFWYVGFHDADGVEIARDDAGRVELHRLMGRGDAITIERRFAADRRPASCTIWPTDRRGRWLDRIHQSADCLIALEECP